MNNQTLPDCRHECNSDAERAAWEAHAAEQQAIGRELHRTLHSRSECDGIDQEHGWDQSESAHNGGWKPASTTDARKLVCFTSSFAYESADNISHATLDGKKTLCGRSGWATEDPWSDIGPDCLRCRASIKRQRL